MYIQRKDDVKTEERPHEDTARRRPSASQGERGFRRNQT